MLGVEVGAIIHTKSSPPFSEVWTLAETQVQVVGLAPVPASDSLKEGHSTQLEEEEE